MFVTSRFAGIIHLLSKVYIACFIFIFMEWLFFVSKPSILSYYTVPEKISVIFLSPMLIFISLLPVVLILFLVDVLFSGKYKLQLATAVPVFIYGSVIFLLVENFSNTLFGFYSATFQGLTRFVYLIAFTALLVFLYMRSTRAKDLRTNRKLISANHLLTVACLCVAVILAITTRSNLSAGRLDTDTHSTSRTPNILILSSDGINRRNMSAYGYDRDTSPFIKSLMDNSLVSTNHFANSSYTGASVISLLTGKLPATTHVIYQPDGLRGIDSYEHLPGILQKRGYTNADISIRYYADSLDLNLQEGFHVANDRNDIGNLLAGLFSPVFSRYPEQGVFLQQSLDRISSRLLHITGIRNTEDVFELVTETDGLYTSITLDDARIGKLLDFINNSSEPFFVHLHLLGTHGPRFRPKDPLYSKGQEQTANHMRDFYDDSIRDYDRYVSDIYRFLEEKGILENTLVIINSDHSRNPNVGLPVPLIIDFPGDQYSGAIEINTQRLDLAPTILAYLGIDIPDWMEGQSLLSIDADPRLIFAYSPDSIDYVSDVGWTVVDPQPPFYTLNNVYVLNCHRIYQLRIRQRTFTNRAVPGHTAPCNQDELLPAYQIAKAILSHLEERDYDTSSLAWLTAMFPDIEELMSKSHATLKENMLYLPAVEYQQEIYAAVLRKNDSGNYLLEDFHLPLNKNEISVFNQETQSFLLNRADVNGEIRNLRLTLISTNPNVFAVATID